MALLTTFAAYSAIYKAQLWVGTVIRKLAMATARMPFDVKIKLNDTDSRMENGPLAGLLERPNQRMSGFKLWEWTSSTRDIYGEAFWLKLRDNKGIVRELHPMHPTNVIVRRNAAGEIEYFYAAGTRNVSMLPPIPADDVVAFVSYNPDTPHRGLSILESLRMTLLNEDASRRATASMWAKGARPAVILSTEASLSQGAQDRLRAQFDASHAGVDNTGATAVFEEGIKPTIIQLNAEEMQYIESRKLNREEVCAAYDVPPPVVHILDHATFSNITEQLRSQYRDTMAPRFVGFESVINHQLVPDFYPRGDVYTRFNMDEVLRGDFESRATAAVALRNAGLITGNQGVALFGYPRSEKPQMDDYFANAALVPLGTPATRLTIAEAATPSPAADAEAAQAIADAGGTPAPVGDAAKAVRFRDVMGKAGRVKGSKSAIRATLVTEHQKALGALFDEQRASVKSGASSKAAGSFDPAAWDGDLASILHTLSKATALAIGTKVAADLGGQYSSDDIAAYLESNSTATAKKVNQATADEIAKAFENAAADAEVGDTVDSVFDGEVNARAGQISLSRVAMVAGLASLVAARLSDAKTKTWVTGGNPRGSHAAMSGETVPLGETFSNGMSGPGDYSGGAEEVANCNCDLDFSTEG
ncbi:phage portal protein [Glaciihabitans sp. UYNi722]|uniref:phage portal protein n=1 Tax=Glaciihabitans sp. UYNi722 TaxID=3156344 RepID=UPI003391EE60